MFLLLFVQTETLHDVYTMLDTDESVAVLKLRDGLDTLHQSQMRNKFIHFLPLVTFVWFIGYIASLRRRIWISYWRRQNINPIHSWQYKRH